jgi:hypothetical protein
VADQINDRDEPQVNAVIRPATIHCKASIGAPAARLTAVGTLTATAEVLTPPRTPMRGFPITDTLVINWGTDGEYHEIELIENGKSISFYGNTPLQGKAKIMHHVLRRNPDFPNN